MPVKVTFIAKDGSEAVVAGHEGDSVMETARRNNVPGIVAECGGVMVCATCHVYVDDTWIDRLPPRSPTEDEMLDCIAAERKPNSRLSCQLRLAKELDGLVVRTPDEQ